MQDLLFFKEALESALPNHLQTAQPKGLYAPMDYILTLGGKRLRPALTLLTCDFFGGDYKKALPAALAVELFHNFSLIHDDIMDEAPLRRGKETVHYKWNLNTGILSGDAMLILAYQYFEEYEAPLFRDLAKLFSKTAIEVCEGQQYDVDFETQEGVELDAYLRMIEYKTAVLLGAAMKMGAMVAGADEDSQNGIYEFGRNLGIAFQLQDDYLDAFGNPETFGKQVGGDIIANKKTYLYIMALEKGNEQRCAELRKLFENTTDTPSDQKVARVKELFLATGASSAIQGAIEEYTQKAFLSLSHVHLGHDKKEKLRNLGASLMNRSV